MSECLSIDTLTCYLKLIISRVFLHSIEQQVLLLSLWAIGALASSPFNLQFSSYHSGFGGYEIFQKLHQEPPPPEITQGTEDYVGEYWVEQKLDHFDRKNNRTWSMVIYYYFGSHYCW